MSYIEKYIYDTKSEYTNSKVVILEWYTRFFSTVKFENILSKHSMLLLEN